MEIVNLAIAGFAGFVLGFFTCGWFTSGKLEDMNILLSKQEAELRSLRNAKVKKVVVKAKKEKPNE